MSLAHLVSGYNRKRKWKIFLEHLCPKKSDQILNVGYSNNEYSPNDNYIEKNYPFQNKITALGIEPSDEFNKRYPEVKTIRYDGGRFPFKDNEFDICWSNAVIEHVGSSENQLYFLKEIKRVSKRAFVTTPNKYFPIEPHTRTPLLHYLPKSVFDAYLRLIGKSWATDNYMHLLSIGKVKRLLSLAGITKYKIIRNRLFGFTLDFVIIF